MHVGRRQPSAFPFVAFLQPCSILAHPTNTALLARILRHRAWREDRRPLRAGVPVELAFDLFPTATLVKAGQRLRLTFIGADAANARTPPSSSQWTLHWDRTHPSFVELPLMTR